jgi:hypothetical protein
MAADFTLVVSGFLAAKSAAAEVKCDEVNPPFSVQACCVWVADSSGFFRILQDFAGICRGKGLFICLQSPGRGS